MTEKHLSKFLDWTFALGSLFGLISLGARNLAVAEVCFTISASVATAYFYLFKEHTKYEATLKGVFWFMFTNIFLLVSWFTGCAFWAQLLVLLAAAGLLIWICR